MSKLKEILVPDVGEATDVEVIEILVAVGDRVGTDESLVVLESEKASMEIPSPTDGEVERIQVQEGDKVEEGDLILELSVQASPTSGTLTVSNWWPALSFDPPATPPELCA